MLSYRLAATKELRRTANALTPAARAGCIYGNDHKYGQLCQD
jgi:hypothetical protein